MYTILAINPGSTSTKVAIYQDDKAVRELTLRHSTEELAPFAGVLDQFDFRKQIILDAMKEAGVTLSDIDAVIGRGGLIKPDLTGLMSPPRPMRSSGGAGSSSPSSRAFTK